MLSILRLRRSSPIVPVSWGLLLLLLCAARLGLPEAKAEDAAKKDTAASIIPSNSSSPSYRFSEGKAQTTLFGVTAEGYKFVYVLDRSASMGGAAQVALRAVKAEIAKSLETLDSVHQFQIIYYNERPVLFNPTGVPELAFATEQNKERAIRFVNSIVPDGGTQHDDAVKLALRLRPDVIFLLTDGDKPELSDREIEEISRRAAGITIHTIEFGVGPATADNFLAKLAKKNAGQHVYVDLSKHLPAKGQDGAARKDPHP